MENKTVNITPEQIEQQYAFMMSVREKNDSFANENGRRPKAHVLTFGCQQNEADSEYISGMAFEMGYELTDKPESFVEKMNALNIPGVEVRREPSVKCGITGTHMAVTVDGEEDNIKLTTPRDMLIAELILKERGSCI